jgi:hypothetical protein
MPKIFFLIGIRFALARFGTGFAVEIRRKSLYIKGLGKIGGGFLCFLLLFVYFSVKPRVVQTQ